MILTRMSITTADPKNPEIIDTKYYEIKDFFANTYHAFADSDELTIRDENGNDTKIPIKDVTGLMVLVKKIPDEEPKKNNK